MSINQDALKLQVEKSKPEKLVDDFFQIYGTNQIEQMQQIISNNANDAVIAAEHMAKSFRDLYLILAMKNELFPAEPEIRATSMITGMLIMCMPCMKALKNQTDKIQELTESLKTMLIEVFPDIFDYVNFEELKKLLLQNNMQEMQEIPKAPQLNLKNFQLITTNDRLSKLVFTDERLYSDELRGVKTGKLKVFCCLGTELWEEFTEQQKLRRTDKFLHDIIMSFKEQGTNIITLDMINKAMTGNPKAKLTPKKRIEINESMLRLRKTTIKIGLDEKEICRYKGLQNLRDAKGIKFEGELVNVKKAAVKRKNGEFEEAWKILDVSILYEYAKAKKQIKTNKIEIMNTPLNKNPETIELQQFLYQCICDMNLKGRGGTSNKILWKKLEKELDITADTPGAMRKKKFDTIEQIQTILTYWKEISFIDNYRFEYGGKDTKKYNEIRAIIINDTIDIDVEKVVTQSGKSSNAEWKK